MAQIQALRGSVEQAPRRRAERAAQLEALRKMLLAMVQDVRVVLIKLADQLQMPALDRGARRRAQPRARRRATTRSTSSRRSPTASASGS